MIVDIHPFDPSQALDGELAEHYKFALATHEVDRPNEPVVGYDNFVGRLRTCPAGIGEQRFWVARHNGRLVGIVDLLLPSSENANMTIVQVQVRPDARRRGIGTSLLRVAVQHGDGRDLIVGAGIREGSDGARWAGALGFVTTTRIARQVLDVSGTDVALWHVPIPAGYRLERWVGAVPDALIDSYAQARTAITDAPMNESSYRHPVWTAERVREAEAEAAASGIEQRVVVAVHENTGTVAGLTEIALHPGMLDEASQRDTAVLARHRGHGLGRCLKAAMMKWLVTERSGIARVSTTTDASNSHMIEVNHQLGYRTLRVMTSAESRRADLEQRLNLASPR